jgi:hypothetical protein
MTNAILADAEGLAAVMLNMYAKFSILPYKFTGEVPGDDNARLFSCVGLHYDHIYEPDVKTEYFAGQLTE